MNAKKYFKPLEINKNNSEKIDFDFSGSDFL